MSEDAGFSFERTNAIYHFTDSCVCHFIIIDCRKIGSTALRLATVSNVHTKFGENLWCGSKVDMGARSRHGDVTVLKPLRRESGPISVKQFPLINGECGSNDATVSSMHS
jgi:hypothetical protein